MIRNDFRIRYYLIFSVILITTLLFSVIDKIPFLFTHTPCIFKNITGIPCPGCGMGHGTVCLLKGNLKGVLEFNVLVFPFFAAVIIGICWMTIDLIRDKESFFPLLKRKFHPFIMIILFAVIILNWIWNIYRGV